MDDEWFDISVSDWLEDGFIGKELKLLANAQFPNALVSEIRSANIKIDKVPSSHFQHEDKDILKLAESEMKVLLTLDSDFWDDRKYPLHTLKTGIIYIAESPSNYDGILNAFGLVYTCFAKSYPLDWWPQLKVRCVHGRFELKMRNWEGRTVGYEMKLEGRRILARETIK
jgi:hypothetical protein